jgi:hypothetical protein
VDDTEFRDEYNESPSCAATLAELREKYNESPSCAAPAPGTCPIYTEGTRAPTGLTPLLFVVFRLFCNILVATEPLPPPPRETFVLRREGAVDRLAFESISILPSSQLSNNCA